MRNQAGRLRRYGFALLTIAVGMALMAIPVIRQPGTPIILYFFAILLAAWYGGLGPGLLTTAIIIALTSHTEFTTWRVVRLVLGTAGGVSISLLAETLHAARRRAERSEERYRAFIANSSEGIWCFEADRPVPIDRPEDEQLAQFHQYAYLAECNDAMARMYGFERAGEILGRRIADFLDPSDPRSAALLRAFIRSGYRLTDAEAHGADREGRPKVFQINFVGAVERGQIHRAWGTQRDVTELRRTRAALEVAKEAAEAANRAKDQFLAVLSHELRTPLTPVLATVTAMLDEPESPAEVRPTLELIRRSIELEARLIDDLLDVTRITRGKLHLQLERVDVHELLHQTIGICRSELYGKQMRLRLDLAAARHHTEADPARLQQVLWNLIKNAVKFTPAGGDVTIRTRDDGPTAPGPDGDGRLVVEVSDSGMGIAPESLARIFRPFEQGGDAVGRQFGGLGLGLAISRSVAEAHGGRLSAESPGPGLGARFALELKTADAPARSATPAATAGGPTASPGRSLRILLVEDDRPTLRVMARLLEQRRYEVTAAATMADALEAGRAEDFDLVVSDVGLPDGTGWELMRRLNEHRPIPGIALTGFGMEEDIRRTHEAGFAAHLTKPVNFVRLEAAIQRVTAASAG